MPAGLQVFSGGVVTVDITDRLTRIVGVYTVSAVRGSWTTQAVSGMVNDGTWAVVVAGSQLDASSRIISGGFQVRRAEQPGAPYPGTPVSLTCIVFRA